MMLKVVCWCLQLTLLTGQDDYEDYTYDEVDVDSLAKGSFIHL